MYDLYVCHDTKDSKYEMKLKVGYCDCSINNVSHNQKNCAKENDISCKNNCREHTQMSLFLLNFR